MSFVDNGIEVISGVQNSRQKDDRESQLIMNQAIYGQWALANIIEAFRHSPELLGLLFDADIHCPIDDTVELVLRFRMSEELFSKIAVKRGTTDA